MRLLNLSPLTDGYVSWKTDEALEKYSAELRFPIQANRNEWQEVVCHVDTRWSGRLDQFKLRFPGSTWRGDLWIASIELIDGLAQVEPARPDVCSDRVIPRLTLPGISQEQFADAFKVLDECLITQVPVFGFDQPVMGPGGAYGECWWQLDSSLAVAGPKWVNQEFAENVMRGFKTVQEANPDGRIDGYGAAAIPGQVGDVSSLPRLFELGYDVARRTESLSLRREIYGVMKRYLDWWLSPVKRDRATGLITATGEETFGGAVMSLTAEQKPQTETAVDLNGAVAVGCARCATLASALGKSTESENFQNIFRDLSDAINSHLWSEKDGVYYNYNVREGKRIPRLICTIFDPLRLQIAPVSRVKRLLPKLVDPALFNWGRLPVTSIAKTEPDYVEQAGRYNGRQWYGDVWTMRNLEIVAGLRDSGCHGVAAELAWSTIKAFNANYTEYLIPSTGEGDGVRRYAWSASLYIQAIIEYLFGVDFDRLKGRLRIFPNIPKELFGQEIWLHEVILPHENSSRLSVKVNQSAPGKAEVEVLVSGSIPKMELLVLLPSDDVSPTVAVDERGRKISMAKGIGDLLNVSGVRLALSKSALIRFE